MEKDIDWNKLLRDHPIFTLPKPTEAYGKGKGSLELSLASLSKSAHTYARNDGPTPSKRRQVMVINDNELFVAVGSEIRMAPLAEPKLGGSPPKPFKVCQFSRILHTDTEIR